jgi:hypothetical protein
MLLYIRVILLLTSKHKGPAYLFSVKLEVPTYNENTYYDGLRNFKPWVEGFGSDMYEW